MTNQSKREMINKDYSYVAIKGKECGVCGISSFDHIHRKGTLPKDFEMLPSDKKPSLEKWEKRFDDEFEWIDNLNSNMASEWGGRVSDEFECRKAVKAFIKSLLSLSRQEGRDEAIEEAIQSLEPIEENMVVFGFDKFDQPVMLREPEEFIENEVKKKLRDKLKKKV